MGFLVPIEYSQYITPSTNPIILMGTDENHHLSLAYALYTHNLEEINI